MKWFSHEPLSTDPDIFVDQCVGYLSKSGDMPERDITTRLLFDHLRMQEVSYESYKKVVKLDAKSINYWLAMFGNSNAIEALLNNSPTDQGLLANLIRNKNIEKEHVPFIEQFLDDSEKGKLNRKILKYG
jgi:hypothetical protein